MELVSAIIVTYYPQPDILKRNINMLLEQVPHVIIVDNTDKRLKWLDCFGGYKSVEIINNEVNQGIATALNQGCRKALQMGYKWAVTLDQDSILPVGFVNDLWTGLPQGLKKIGAIGPVYTSFGNYIGERGKVVKIDSVITSGCLMNLTAFEMTGGFLDELFIDMVDIEYCWRLKQNNYSVLMNGNAVLDHQLGNRMISKKVFGKVYQYADHSPLRTYYFTRNVLWVTKRYKTLMPFEYADYRYGLKKEIFKIIFVSDKKVKKIFYVFWGYLHYLTNRLGEL